MPCRRVRRRGCIFFDNNLSPAILPLAESNLGLCTRWSRRPWTSALMIVFFWTASPLQWINACIFHSSVFITLHTCIFHAHVVAVHVLYLFVFFLEQQGCFELICVCSPQLEQQEWREALRGSREGRGLDGTSPFASRWYFEYIQILYQEDILKIFRFCIRGIFQRYFHFASE